MPILVPGCISRSVLSPMCRSSCDGCAWQGHSLGGAYSTLVFGEFLRLKYDQPETKFQRYNFGDRYTFGAPRVCLLPFAEKVNANNQRSSDDTKSTYLFRIVNAGDPIPTIPPATLWGLEKMPYVHVGGGYKLSTSGPEAMPDEPPQVEPQIFVPGGPHGTPPMLITLSPDLTMSPIDLSIYYENWTHTGHM